MLCGVDSVSFPNLGGVVTGKRGAYLGRLDANVFIQFWVC